MGGVVLYRGGYRPFKYSKLDDGDGQQPLIPTSAIIDMAELNMDRKIGCGGCGEVYLAEWRLQQSH